jgi:hypothetical protein
VVMSSKVCLRANKDTTWVMDSGATDHLVKENTPVINRYKLSINIIKYYTAW